MKRDTIFSEPLNKVSEFSFDEKVVKVFDDMIQRSVPGYKTIISAIGLLAEQYAQKNSCCYDLGCSLGAATLAMRHQIDQPNCQIIAVDNSQAMVDQFAQKLAADPAEIPVEILHRDIREVAIDQASIVVLNFTLQFLPENDRRTLLETIYHGLLPGGILILSEKLRYDDPRQQNLHADMHALYKKAQGYSDLEISQKRSALENVLIPETLVEHKQRLQQVGFASTEVWFQYFNFASMIALK